MTQTLDKMPIEIGKSKKYLDVLYWLGLKGIFDRLNLLIFCENLLQKYYITKESYFSSMKSTFL